MSYVHAPRPRRLRQSPVLRDIVAETVVPAKCMMLPHFVLPGKGQRVGLEAMPGIERLSVDLLLAQVEADLELGIRQVILFGVPDTGDKDATGSAAAAETGVVPQAVRALKSRFGADLVVATDVCLCAYTSHGHCGVLHGGRVDNDASLPHLSHMALAHAQAGADIVAPSDMMDFRVGHMRGVLDAHGKGDTLIMSYSVKYASAYYGPFREAAGSAPGKGDRKSYQMDPRNVREARREVVSDEAEGADILMVKPAMAYLDVIRAVREASALPLACYNVSGEYAMVKAAAARGWIDERGIVLENLVAMRRAGADILITYHARDALRGGWL
ncbi:MAG TPA: porphobilinogen synthase [Myxococcota bacterium]|nr:porphobilinogen synthase [Myxococcota bacterium]